MERNYRNDDEGLSIADVAERVSAFKALLIKRKYTIILSSLFSALLLLGITFLFKPVYRAKVTFVLEEGEKSGGLMGGYLNLASQFGLSGIMQNNGYSAENIIELLKTRALVREGLLSPVSIPGKGSVLLIDYYIDRNELREGWKDNARLKNLSFSKKGNGADTLTRDSVISGICDEVRRKMVIGKMSRESNILYIEYPSGDQLLSRGVVENLLAALRKYYTERKTIKAREVLKFVQHRADSVRYELNRAEMALARVKDASRGLIKAEGYLHESRLMRDVEILNIMYGEIIKNLELSKFTLLNQTPLFQVIDKPILPLEKEVKLRKSTALILGALIGFILSCMYALVSGQLSTTRAKEQDYLSV